MSDQKPFAEVVHDIIARTVGTTVSLLQETDPIDDSKVRLVVGSVRFYYQKPIKVPNKSVRTVAELVEYLKSLNLAA